MRLTAFILLAGCLEVTAAGYSQTVTLSVKGEPLEKVFREIQTQTGFTFVYYKEDLQKARPVDLQVSDAPIEDALAACFRDQPFTYTIVDKYVVVKQKILIDNAQKDSPPPPGDIIGNVTDSSGVPMENVNITVKRTHHGTITDARGNFVLHNVAENDVLVFSYVGFDNLSMPVKGRSNIHLKMKPATSMLDEAVVQAYGKTSQRLTTGDIGKLTAQEIETQPVMNPLLTLQGRIPGLEITPTSGYASAPIKVEIMGRNSLNSNFSSDPLYIIDGVPLTVLNIASQSASYYSAGSPGFIQNGMNNPANGQSPFFSLNPNDIESIEVLKDADATAIYGSRAANGVILITTKKGRSGKTQFNFDVSQGVSSLAGLHWNMLNNTQYFQMRREALAYDGIIPTPSNAPDLLVWDTTRNVDWQKTLWGNTGKWTAAQMALSGGNEQTNFRLAVGYNRQTDILTFSGADQRGSMSFNFTHHTLDQRFSLAFSAVYTFSEVNIIPLPSAVDLPPNAPEVFDSKGNLNYAQWDALGATSSLGFPFNVLLRPYDSKTNFLNSSLSLNYNILKGLSGRINLGYNNAQTNQTQFTPIASQDPANNPKGTAQFGHNWNNNVILEPQVEYNSYINKGKLNILIGSTWHSIVTEGLYVVGLNYTNDALLRTITNAPNVVSTDNYGQYKYAALFARINYNWENKYIVNVNVRRDGSSRFGPGEQFGNFGSIGAAWIFSEDQWLKNHLPSFITFGKLRGNYGITGSDAIGDYRYLSQWSSNGITGNYDGIAPLVPQLNLNPDYHWEVNHKLEGALDLGFAKDRLNVSAVRYINHCDNQLVQFPTPLFTGFPDVTSNFPANVQNTGWEFSLNAKIIEHKDFEWSLNFNIESHRNKLLAYPNIQNSPYANVYKIGYPLNLVYLLHYTGVDPQTGQYSYYDKNHDGNVNIDYSVQPGSKDDDRYIIYNLDPKFTGGVANNFRYDNWNVSFFFYFKKQIGLNALNSSYGGGISNISTYQFNNSWHKQGDLAQFARFTTNPVNSDYYFSTSDGAYTDASFVRLSNVNITYSLLSQKFKKTGLKGARIFINAQNLFVITKYKGVDPETQRFGGMPPAKTIAAGFSLNF